MSSAAIIRAATTIPCRPWPRHTLTVADWAALAPDDVRLAALWADTTAVYALFLDPAGEPLLASTAAQDECYAALSRRFPAAALPERMVCDLWGHVAEGAVDPRPWLDHGQWGFSRPLALRHGPPTTAAEPVFIILFS